MKRGRDDTTRILNELNKQEAILKEVQKTLKRVKCNHEKNKFTCKICNDIPVMKVENQGYENLILAIESNYYETGNDEFDICIHGYTKNFCGECEILSKLIQSFSKT